MLTKKRVLQWCFSDSFLYRFSALGVKNSTKSNAGGDICSAGASKLNWILVALILISYTLKAQTSTTQTFGQNRVQYKDFTFSYYQSDNFITYFYQGGQDVAKYVIKTAEDDGDEISKMLDFRYKKKIDIIVYNSINELNQTNIGIYQPDQNPGGTVKIPDGKIFIYFNGDHSNLEKQIREGIAKIYIDKNINDEEREIIMNRYDEQMQKLEREMLKD